MERPEGKYAETVTVGTKGQIVIPKEARDVFDIHPGDHLLILHLADAEQGMAIPPRILSRILQKSIPLSREKGG
jgi:AbrB family looped-hinge helix DNA binding protein